LVNVIAVTQARVGSTRLPGKILMEIQGTSLLEIHLKRVLQAKQVSRVIVATTFEDGVEKICQIADKFSVTCFQGSTIDVLDRFYQAVKESRPDYVVRITSDCPLIDAELLDKIIQFTIDNNLDYCSNTLIEEYPDGQDIEVFTFDALQKAWMEATLSSEREHVTPFLRRNCDFNGGHIFKSLNYNSPNNFKHIRMTVDELDDFEFIKKIILELGLEKTWKEYTQYIVSNYDILKNQQIVRNEGYINSIKNENLK
jgi:spore coat polysaccharide biosynthesis protein SpsF (cytidylyltransferase family)